MLQVGRVQQAGLRQRDKVRVGNVPGAVSIGQPVGFRDHVHRISGVGLEAGQIKILQHAQRLQQGDAARAGWRHAAHFVMAAVHRAHRRAHLAGVAAEVGQGQAPRVGRVAADLGDHVLRHGAGVEGVGTAAGNAAQGGG